MRYYCLSYFTCKISVITIDVIRKRLRVGVWWVGAEKSASVAAQHSNLAAMMVVPRCVASLAAVLLLLSAPAARGQNPCKGTNPCTPKRLKVCGARSLMTNWRGVGAVPVPTEHPAWAVPGSVVGVGGAGWGGGTAPRVCLHYPKHC